MTHYVDDFGRRIDLDVRPVKPSKSQMMMRRCGRMHSSAVCAACRAIEDEQRRQQHRRWYARRAAR